VIENEIDKLRARGVRVKALMAVPKFWIYLLKELLEELKGKPVLCDLGEKILAIEKNGHLQNLGMIDKAKLTATRLLLRDKLGGHFSYGISSSSKLDPAIVEIFRQARYHGARHLRRDRVHRDHRAEPPQRDSSRHLRANSPEHGVAAGPATPIARVVRARGVARGQRPDRGRGVPGRWWRDRTAGPHARRLARHRRPRLGG